MENTETKGQRLHFGDSFFDVYLLSDTRLINNFSSGLPPTKNCMRDEDAAVKGSSSW